LYPYTKYEEWDANDITDSRVCAFYNAVYVPSHIPFDGNGLLFALRFGPYILQLLFGVNGRCFHFRYGTDGNPWSVWYKV
jgi:hypothetical protein